MIKIARPKLISPSQILAYKNDEQFRWGCPRKYFYQHIFRLKPEPKLCLISGNIVHNTISEFLKTPHTLDSPLESDHYEALQKSIFKIFNRRWFGSQAEFDRLPDSPSDIKRNYIECRQMIRNFFEVFYKKVLQVYDECGDFNFAVDRAKPQSEIGIVADGYKLYVRIDALENNGRIIITDFKTSKKNEMTPEIRLQLSLCALAYFDKFGKRPDMVQAHFLRHEDGVISVPVTSQMLRDAEKAITEHMLATSSNDERDYPCLCGGRCSRDFNINNGERPNQENPARCGVMQTTFQWEPSERCIRHLSFQTQKGPEYVPRRT